MACVTFAIFMLFYNRRITRAIVEISNEVRQIGDGNLQLQLVASGDDELARLTESVEEMRRSILKKRPTSSRHSSRIRSSSPP
ncbi:MAG: HAMP domain-containing protein [Oscillospiraceae bacterium]